MHVFAWRAARVLLCMRTYNYHRARRIVCTSMIDHAVTRILCVFAVECILCLSLGQTRFSNTLRFPRRTTKLDCSTQNAFGATCKQNHGRLAQIKLWPPRDRRRWQRRKTSRWDKTLDHCGRLNRRRSDRIRPGHSCQRPLSHRPGHQPCVCRRAAPRPCKPRDSSRNLPRRTWSAGAKGP